MSCSYYYLSTQKQTYPYGLIPSEEVMERFAEKRPNRVVYELETDISCADKSLSEELDELYEVFKDWTRVYMFLNID